MSHSKLVSELRFGPRFLMNKGLLYSLDPWGLLFMHKCSGDGRSPTSAPTKPLAPHRAPREEDAGWESTGVQRRRVRKVRAGREGPRGRPVHGHREMAPHGRESNAGIRPVC